MVSRGRAKKAAPRKPVELLDRALAVPPASRERVRQCLLELAREGSVVTTTEVQRRCGGMRAHLVAVVAAWRGHVLDVDQPWDRLDLGRGGAPAPGAPAGAPSAQAAPARGGGSPALAELLALIDAATTPRGIAEVAQRVAHQVAAGELESAAGRIVLDALREQRQALAQARAVEPPPEEATSHALITREALEVAKAYDYLVCDARRARVAALVAAELQADLLEQPHNPDTAGPGR